ncbi:MAG: hypothetical protein E6300_16595 [Clostridium sp.]|uniref:hypothetical protein n=1 Tax=Clostridium sp. TaxID=1506 RepID=UPI00290D7AD5|nr:hypothetical protein [Clostridium sp.]MDU7150096.1 hypothetical protein [Clostridium sp.]
MAKERKSVAFSTRFTESMDNALEELSDTKMLTKHDLVRVALSEYLLQNKHLIDANKEYKANKSEIRYDDFDLVTVTSSSTGDTGKWIQGIDFDENGDPVLFEDLVKIEVNIPLTEEKEKIPELLSMLKNASESEKQELQDRLMKLVSYKVVEEYTLRYTEKGLKIKNDPRFQLYVNRCINELIDKVKGENSK